jgi:archaellum biogenesis protein FlaJ (TadC family)
LKFKPSAFAYNLLGKRLESLFPQFEDLHTQLKKGGVRITYKAYVSFMFFISIIAFVASLVLSLVLLPFLMNVPFFSVVTFVLSFMLAGLTFVMTLIITYVYPGIIASNRKLPIENNMPYISSFLTLLSSSNVPPSTIFQSVTRIDTLKEVRQEFSNIVRDVEVFGVDLMNSILENAKYTPNEKLREMLTGYVATVRTGGSPTEYLKIQTENITKERMSKLDMMLESLSGIAEIYIMVLVAMPLLFVVLFATLGMIGSGGSMINPRLFLYLLTYAGIPILGAVMTVIVSTYEK